MISKQKGIILDYDGVIAESNHIKTDAFRELFKKEKKEHTNQFIEYHLNNEGVSRTEKIKYFFYEILKKRISKKEISSKAAEFSSLVVKQVIDSKKVKGVRDFLKNNYKKKDLFISTGTPTEEIKFILEETNMKIFFQDIFGSPNSKEMHISFILKNYKYNKENLLFIGDSKTDLLASEKYGIRFILRTHKFNKKLSDSFKGSQFKNFLEISKFLDDQAC